MAVYDDGYKTLCYNCYIILYYNKMNRRTPRYIVSRCMSLTERKFCLRSRDKGCDNDKKLKR